LAETLESRQVRVEETVLFRSTKTNGSDSEPSHGVTASSHLRIGERWGTATKLTDELTN
jgi:hypothetical protein